MAKADELHLAWVVWDAVDPGARHTVGYAAAQNPSKHRPQIGTKKVGWATGVHPEPVQQLHWHLLLLAAGGCVAGVKSLVDEEIHWETYTPFAPVDGQADGYLLAQTFCEQVLELQVVTGKAGWAMAWAEDPQPIQQEHLHVPPPLLTNGATAVDDDPLIANGTLVVDDSHWVKSSRFVPVDGQAVGYFVRQISTEHESQVVTKKVGWAMAWDMDLQLGPKQHEHLHV